MMAFISQRLRLKAIAFEDEIVDLTFQKAQPASIIAACVNSVFWRTINGSMVFSFVFCCREFCGPDQGDPGSI